MSRRSSRARARRLTATATGVLALVACSRGADARDPVAFCERLRLLQPALTDASNPAALLALYQDLDDEAPLQIKDDWHTLTELIARVTSFDPGNPTESQAVLKAALLAQVSVDTVGRYVRDTCAIDLGPVVDVPPVGGTGDSLLTDPATDTSAPEQTSG